MAQVDGGVSDRIHAVQPMQAECRAPPPPRTDVFNESSVAWYSFNHLSIRKSFRLVLAPLYVRSNLRAGAVSEGEATPPSHGVVTYRFAVVDFSSCCRM